MSTSDAGEPAAQAGRLALTGILRSPLVDRAGGRLGRVDDVLRPLGLTFARYELLMLLSFSRTGALPLGKVGERLQVHPASVTNLIDRLETDGLVRRRSHPSDARIVLARISAAGRRLATRATTDLNAQVFEAIGLSEAESSQLFRLLRKIRHDAGDFE